ncbi:hypothetical protein INR49_029136, partial [Caranx melampygus]
MLPARLAQLHPANEGLFIGLRLSAAKQGLARAEAGASIAVPPTPTPTYPQLHSPLHMPVLFPDTCEESASPFVFICTNPQELLVKFPMKGKHKICKSSFFH